MIYDHVYCFELLLSLGLATLILGVLTLGLSQFSARRRAVFGLSLYSVAMAGFGGVVGDALALTVSAGVAAMAFLVYLDGRFGLTAMAFGSSKRVSLGLALLGLSTIGASMLLYQLEDDELVARIERETFELTATAKLHSIEGIAATTDRGRPMTLKVAESPRSTEDLVRLNDLSLRDHHLVNRVILHEPASEDCNCHGWVFTGGRYWIGADDVEVILEDNGYQQVEHPRPGDLAIYRKDGLNVHTAIVRYVAEGKPVMVEGKWGGLGVFLHEVDRCCYHADPVYYSTKRPTHLLREFVGTTERPPIIEATWNADGDD